MKAPPDLVNGMTNEPSEPLQPSSKLPPDTSLSPVTQALLPSYRRLISTHLPIRYPDRFYALATSSPSDTGSIALCIVYTPPSNHDRQRNSGKSSQANDIDASRAPQVVAAIQGRLEPVSETAQVNSQTADGNTSETPTATQKDECEIQVQHYRLYVQTLTTAPAYRDLGLATFLLQAFARTALATEYESLHPSRAHKPKSTPAPQTTKATQNESPVNGKSLEETSGSETSTPQASISHIYAHVWEANTDALEWYSHRGFEQEEKVEAYYRRLKPGGAVVMTRRIGVGDYLNAERRDGG